MTEILRSDVLISGGGLVGQALALALAHHGLSSQIVDPADPVATIAPGFDGRASAIASATWQMFEVLGITDRLAGHGCAIHAIKVSDGGQAGELDFVTSPEDRALGTMVENRQLRLALAAALAEAPLVRLFMPSTVVHRDMGTHGVTLTLGDGTRLAAPLLIVAEGRRSPTRDAAGFGIANWSYHHHAMIGAVAHSKSHGNVAHEIFFPSGPFALLPLVDDDQGRHRSAFVWTVSEKDGPGFAKLGDRGFTAELEKRAGDLLGSMALVAPRMTYPLGFHHSAKIVGDRIVLVGDAAHGIHPIAGQGLNLGLRDVAALAEVLVEGARLGLDLGDAALLARYQRWRGLDSLMVSLATDGLTRLFGIPGRTASAVRRAGLGAVQRMPMLKRFFMDEARGEAGDLPRLLAGAEI
ncbi:MULTISPECIES: FAD-dependent monooxygenase [unclassified Sphingopyxis]|uniref:FAD-dependent monooxygenase n=1 Tax=unclassified Sphingopyxis TaxID=2614943 RepID=UPI00073127F8|nr:MULTISPECIES: FAD-dependent monooxygenase [unclassified Sphingopyxis]KTE27048.1 ubiquinone biosynthesis protein UbiH [Sphingopyxis sp. H057]KTE54354.1 ubiquinone biosynthesis protein UbiH [Sphingopyxis sp. H073]KTE56674.1 ubiquinone biosynthesis protein UbiH [Sphingopyxis sp. H071]KTE58265.1 ubiquinone biosynthesis protein UbiH [Sphingopyxis sp. H107]KTE68203.1 ubiquinone biosynthesis protein UbiH [Sphingopyxis sp. H100]